MFARSLIASAAAASLALTAFGPATAQRPTFDTEAPIAYMIDVNSGQVLFERDAERRIPPASMAKMMTVYVAFKLIDEGELSLDKRIVVRPETWKAWNNQGSAMFLAVGDKPTVADLLHGIVTLSGNDACVVFAEGVAGSESAFAQLMNAEAKRLGLSNSHFGNSNGWPDEGVTYVSARDLAVLGARTYSDYPKLYRQFYGQKDYSWNGIRQENRNPLFGKVDGADGIKTGHTEEAGYGFTGAAEQNGRRIVMVLAGLDSYNGRIAESVKFMNWGFGAWKDEQLFKKGDKIAEAEVQQGEKGKVSLVAPSDLAITLPRTANGELAGKLRYEGPIKAPIKKGDLIATLEVSGQGFDTQTIKLAAGEDVGEAWFYQRIWAGFLSLFGA